MFVGDNQGLLVEVCELCAMKRMTGAVRLFGFWGLIGFPKIWGKERHTLLNVSLLKPLRCTVVGLEGSLSWMRTQQSTDVISVRVCCSFNSSRLKLIVPGHEWLWSVRWEAPSSLTAQISIVKPLCLSQMWTDSVSANQQGRKEDQQDDGGHQEEGDVQVPRLFILHRLVWLWQTGKHRCKA